MKVSLGLIFSHGFPVPAPFVQGFSGLLQYLLTGQGNVGAPRDAQITDARLMFSHAFPIDTARNEIVKLFLDHDNGDALLFLDCDMRHPPDLAHRLLARQVPIVCGRYQMRKPPFYTVAMRKTGLGPNDYQAIDKVVQPVRGLLPIDAGGAGALLIRREVLEAVRARIGDDWFRYQVGPNGQRTVSEDMWFYEQAKAAGFDAYLDADAVCGHIGQFEIDANWAPSEEVLAKAKAAAALVPGSEVVQ